jgi:hypothetical protein
LSADALFGNVYVNSSLPLIKDSMKTGVVIRSFYKLAPFFAKIGPVSVMGILQQLSLKMAFTQPRAGIDNLERTTKNFVYFVISTSRP